MVVPESVVVKPLPNRRRESQVCSLKKYPLPPKKKQKNRGLPARDWLSEGYEPPVVHLFLEVVKNVMWPTMQYFRLKLRCRAAVFNSVIHVVLNCFISVL